MNIYKSYEADEIKLVSVVMFQVWQLESGRCQKTLVGHEDGVTTLTFDQTTIISGSLDCTIRLWCLATGQCVGVLDWMSSEGHTGKAVGGGGVLGCVGVSV